MAVISASALCHGRGHVGVAAMHCGTGNGHQRGRPVVRGVGQCEQLFGAALRRSMPAEGHLRAHEGCERLDETELVVELLEANARLLRQIGCFFQLALPQAQVGEQRVHHAGCPHVAA